MELTLRNEIEAIIEELLMGGSTFTDLIFVKYFTISFMPITMI